MIRAIFLLLIIVSSVLSCTPISEEGPRPVQWATPVQLEGVPNLYKVTDYLYRSSQPTREGMKNLERMGIKTIINLRAFYSDSDEIKETGLRVEELSVKVWHIGDADVVRVLQIIRRRENGPFLIHCSHGSDRAGVHRIWIWFGVVGYVKHADVEKIRKQVET